MNKILWNVIFNHRYFSSLLIFLLLAISQNAFANESLPQKIKSFAQLMLEKIQPNNKQLPQQKIESGLDNKTQSEQKTESSLDIKTPPEQKIESGLDNKTQSEKIESGLDNKTTPKQKIQDSHVVEKSTHNFLNVDFSKSKFFAAAHYRIGFNASGEFKDFGENAEKITSLPTLLPSRGATGFDEYQKISFINGAVELGYQLNQSIRFGIEGIYSQLSPNYKPTDDKAYFEIVRAQKLAYSSMKGDAIVYHKDSSPPTWTLNTDTGMIYGNPVLILDLEKHPNYLAALSNHDLNVGEISSAIESISPNGETIYATGEKERKYYTSAHLAFKLHYPEIVAYGALLNCRYDFNIQNSFMLYAGLGVGWLRVKLLGGNNNTIGYQARAGLNFELDRGLKFDVGYYYLGAFGNEFKNIHTDTPFSDVKSNTTTKYTQDDKDTIFYAIPQSGTKTAHGKLRYGIHGVEIGTSFIFNR